MLLMLQTMRSSRGANVERVCSSLFGRIEWESGDRSHGAFRADFAKERPESGEVALMAEPKTQDGKDDELDVRVLTPMHLSPDHPSHK